MTRLLPVLAAVAGLLVWTQASLARDHGDRHGRQDTRILRYHDGGRDYGHHFCHNRRFSFGVPGFYFNYGRPFGSREECPYGHTTNGQRNRLLRVGPALTFRPG
jgi:hypothetical protein